MNKGTNFLTMKSEMLYLIYNFHSYFRMNQNFNAHQSNILLELPRHILAQIVQYLNKKEVFYILPLTCMSLKMILNQEIFLITKLISLIPSIDHPLCPVDKSAITRKKLISIPDNAYELPFWGYKTNGGIPYQDLKFWIGKSFQRPLM